MPTYQRIAEAAKRLGYSEAYLPELCGSGGVPGAMKFRPRLGHSFGLSTQAPEAGTEAEG
jgi:hypothetical protein